MGKTLVLAYLYFARINPKRAMIPSNLLLPCLLLLPAFLAAQSDTIRLETSFGEVYTLSDYDLVLRDGIAAYTFGDRSVPLAQVKYVTTQAGHFRLGPLRRRRKREFYRRTYDGPRIDLYTASEQKAMSYPQSGSFSQSSSWYEKDKGRLKNISIGNLRLDLDDHGPSRERLRKAAGIRTWQHVSTIAALGLIGWGTVRTSDFQSGLSPALYLAPLLFFIPASIQKPKKRLIREAIELYE